MSTEISVDELAQVIRQADGQHSLGAGALAEEILAKLPHLAARQPVVDFPESLHARVEALREVAARQPVGEPVAWVPAKFFDKGIVAMTARRTPPSAMAVELHGKYVPLFDAPPAQQPAQAVDLERFRGTVKSQYTMTEWMHRCGFVSAEKLEDSKKNHDHLLALIDSQAVGK